MRGHLNGGVGLELMMFRETRYTKYAFMEKEETRLMCSEDPGTTFDWFLTPTYLLPFLEELTDQEAGAQGKGSRTLMLGCGNSALGEAVSLLWSLFCVADCIDVRCWLVGYREYRCELLESRSFEAKS